MIKKLLAIILLTGFVAAANAETDFTAAEQAEAVAAHNKWRSAVAVPGVTWSPTLADTAQAWANHLKNSKGCKLVHSGGNLGENLFWAGAWTYSDGTTKPQVISPTDAITSWAEEGKDYSYETNSCAAGKVCGHYTQIVWKNSSEIGCGKAMCGDDTQVWVCNYSPAGNYVGQKPY